MKYFAAIALAALATPAVAQLAPGPEAFVSFATQVTNNIDQGRAALVWDRSAPTLKSSVAKDRFVSQIVQKQQRNGATIARAWQSVVRTSVTVSERPLVQRPMVTVTFVVTTNKNTTYNEVVQFTAGPDNLWHTSAYIN